ncbi:hypothetical protein [Candidatus Thiosymbion oneisti]|uniref:hypothetical protein n=1 Tax=Candidatus Thiosymbion oneisti TaxID=589554 RepID=UPI000B7D25B6|nr:hypothetical protein [Candidatus Thiosymbion oneisti]
MLTFSELHAQNHQITELSNVFLYLVKDRAMCDTTCARDVFFEYKRRVKEHIELVDQKLCGKLIAYSDLEIKNTADRFLSGSVEIRKIFSRYVKDWCSEKHKVLTIRDHDKFVRETKEMFALVMDRIQRETEHLYPLIRKLEDGEKLAA